MVVLIIKKRVRFPSTHAHVLAELEAYAPLTSVGSYCVVFDTLIEDMPADIFGDRPWGVIKILKLRYGDTLRLIQSLKLIRVFNTNY
jgi:Cephalosporin hydroxylase